MINGGDSWITNPNQYIGYATIVIFSIFWNRMKISTISLFISKNQICLYILQKNIGLNESALVKLYHSYLCVYHIYLMQVHSYIYLIEILKSETTLITLILKTIFKRILSKLFEPSWKIHFNIIIILFKTINLFLI